MTHDISHCQGIGEDLCLSCRRYQAHLEAVDLDYDYVWYMTPPAEATSDSCPYYWQSTEAPNSGELKNPKH